MTVTTATAAKRNKRAQKVYQLANGIPKTLKRSSKGRAVLASIARHGHATAQTIRKDMKRGFPDATLRFYLGKFQRENVVVAQANA